MAIGGRELRKRLREIKADRGWTLQRMARASWMAESVFRDLFYGKRQPQMSTLGRVLVAFRGFVEAEVLDFLREQGRIASDKYMDDFRSFEDHLEEEGKRKEGG